MKKVLLTVDGGAKAPFGEATIPLHKHNAGDIIRAAAAARQQLAPSLALQCCHAIHSLCVKIQHEVDAAITEVANPIE